MQYIDLVRSYCRDGMNLNHAVHRSVDECIEKGILKEFLLQNKAEVIKMSIYEYNEAEEKEKMRIAEREAGREEGLEFDLRKIMKNLKLSLEQAMDVLEVPSQDREKYYLQFSK